MLDLYEEFRKLIGALDERHVDYALCGGIAMAVYDYPRAISLKMTRSSPQDLADIQALREDIDDATN